MKAIGVEMEVRAVDPAIYADQVYLRREFEVINESGTSDYAMGATAHSKWHSKGPTNDAGINDPDLDRLIEAVLAEPDRQKRNQLFTQMQRIIAEKAYYSPIVTLAQFVGIQPWVYEFFPSQSVSPEILDASGLWMDVGSMPVGRRWF